MPRTCRRAMFVPLLLLMALILSATSVAAQEYQPQFVITSTQCVNNDGTWEFSVYIGNEGAEALEYRLAPHGGPDEGSSEYNPVVVDEGLLAPNTWEVLARYDLPQVAYYELTINDELVAEWTGSDGMLPCPGLFSDIDVSSVHGEAVYALAERGIITGYADGTFRPHEPVTRAQVATIVAESTGVGGRPDGPFSDVAPGSTHAGAINALAWLGIISGYADGTFRPHEPVTRAQLASIMSLTIGVLGVPDGPFIDVPAGSTHAGAINALAERGIITGYADGTFRPNEPVTRAQTATIMYRSLIKS